MVRGTVSRGDARRGGAGGGAGAATAGCRCGDAQGDRGAGGANSSAQPTAVCRRDERAGGAMIGRRYRRGIRKRYQPIGWDRFDPNTAVPAGTIVYVVAAWGPFRGLETLDGKPAGSCGKESLVPCDS